jgi:hypothetical protein
LCTVVAVRDGAVVNTPAVTESPLRKLVWFVPEDALEATRGAVFAAGAGRIGEYERCSWYTTGTGTFLPREGAVPAIGEVGREERVSEVRVETVVPAERAADAVRALLAAHPYEEVAYELYPLVDVAS